MVKILVIRFSSIGDIVLTTPVLRMAKKEIEDAEIHFLTKSAYAQILRANPYIDKIHELNDSLNLTVKSLEEESFDYILDLQNSIRSLSIKRSLKRMHFNVNKINFPKWLLVNLKMDILPEKHIVDRYMETLQAFGVENDNEGLDYFLSEEDHVDVSKILPGRSSDYIALVIGAQHATKKLPEDSIADLIQDLNHPVILIGGPEDKDTANRIILSTEGNEVVNGCGSWSINQSASLIKQAACVISHDTGMMHIAAAFKKKIISIWGNTIPKFGMYPYLPDEKSKIFEVEILRCRPCSKLGKDSCPKKHFRCMLDHDLKAIADKANKLSE